MYIPYTAKICLNIGRKCYHVPAYDRNHMNVLIGYSDNYSYYVNM